MITNSGATQFHTAQTANISGVDVLEVQHQCLQGPSYDGANWFCASFILCWLKWPITNRSSLSGHDSWDPVHSIVMVKLVQYCRGES